MDDISLKILDFWLTRSRIAQRTHLKTAERRLKRNKQLGIPVVVLSTTVGTSVFASLNISNMSTWIQIAIGITSILAAVLASLQTFLNFTAEAEKHRSAANRFAKIKHDIEVALVEYANSSNEVIAEFIKRVQTEWDATNDNSPIPDQDIFKKTYKEFDGDENFDYRMKRKE